MEMFDLSIEVVNFFCLTPQITKIFINPIKKTKKLITIDINNTFYGASSELLANILCSGFSLIYLQLGWGAKGSFSPSSRHLVDDYYINLCDIAIAILDSLEIDGDQRKKIMKEIINLNGDIPNDVPNKGFSGPF